MAKKMFEGKRESPQEAPKDAISRLNNALNELNRAKSEMGKSTQRLCRGRNGSWKLKIYGEFRITKQYVSKLKVDCNRKRKAYEKAKKEYAQALKNLQS